MRTLRLTAVACELAVAWEPLVAAGEPLAVAAGEPLAAAGEPLAVAAGEPLAAVGEPLAVARELLAVSGEPLAAWAQPSWGLANYGRDRNLRRDFARTAGCPGSLKDLPPARPGRRCCTDHFGWCWQTRAFGSVAATATGPAGKVESKRPGSRVCE